LKFLFFPKLFFSILPDLFVVTAILSFLAGFSKTGLINSAVTRLIPKPDKENRVFPVFLRGKTLICRQDFSNVNWDSLQIRYFNLTSKGAYEAYHNLGPMGHLPLSINNPVAILATNEGTLFTN